MMLSVVGTIAPCLSGGLTSTGTGEQIGATSVLLTLIGVGCIAALMAPRLARLSKDKAKWAEAKRRWERLYYCERDDGVFIPGETPFIPIEKLQEFLYAEPIRPEARVCPYSGRDASAGPVDQAASSDAAVHLYSCPNCGAAYDVLKTQACPQCHTRRAHVGQIVPLSQRPPISYADAATPDELLRRAIAAAEAGRKSEARDLLTELVRQDKDNEKAWLWLSDIADTPEERAECLRRVLSINPSNAHAERGLGALAQPQPPPSKISRSRWIVLGASGAATIVVLTGLAYLSIKTLHIPPSAGSSSTELPDSVPVVEPAISTAIAHLDEPERTYLLCLEDVQPEITLLYEEINSAYDLARGTPDSTTICGQHAEWATRTSQLEAEHASCPIPPGQIGQTIRDMTDSQLAQMGQAIQCWRVHCDSANARWRDEWLQQGQTHLDQAGADWATVLGLLRQLGTAAQ